MSRERSRLPRSWPAVRRMKPRFFGGLVEARRSRSCRRTLSSSILRETPRRGSEGISTRYRPGMLSAVVTLGPLVPMPSLVIWSRSSSPWRRISWIGSRRGPRPFFSPSAVGCLRLGYAPGTRSETWRKAFFGKPMSTKAAWMLGSMLVTRPLKMLPTRRSVPVRST